MRMMKSLLQAMRLFHYMMGITAPKPEDERKILWVWVGILLLFVLLGTGFAFFIVARILR